MLALLRGNLQQAQPPRLAPSTGGSPSAEASLTPSPTPQPVYQIAGPIPASGPGTWSYAAARGKTLGSNGVVKRFRVAAETNITGDELPAFTAAIDAALGDPRSWIASKQYRLQRVGRGSAYDFTIYLATGETTRKMCATGGMDTRVDGVSYTSCRLPGRVVINLNRWRLSVPDYIATKTELSLYQAYVINHEVGHELGKNHEACPGKDRPAPVMQQQTYGLRGCVANPWPYLNGRRYTGPPI
ncbi:DUF3152 domain-containing protein [Catellatospora sp. NPDC049133]|uniref:DUF3152 domain-containing protein n=1 Tax=Catellatospora sp. NPDC049133 TaxID=3155499 RepID=UPI0033DE8110